MAGNLFINYRRDDARAEARSIRDRLALAFGDKHVFMDVDNLRPGQRFDQELAKVLTSCEIFLAVIGPKWLETLKQRQQTGERDYVREEITSALQRGITCIPIVVDGAVLPSPERLPADIRDLVMHHKIDVSHATFGRDVMLLVDAVSQATGMRPKAVNSVWSKIAAAVLPVAALATIGAIGLVVANVALRYYEDYTREQQRLEAEMESKSQEQREKYAAENAKRLVEQKRLVTHEAFEITQCQGRSELPAEYQAPDFGTLISCQMKSSNRFASGGIFVCPGTAIYGQDGAQRNLSAVETGMYFKNGAGYGGLDIDVGNGLSGYTNLLFKSPLLPGGLLQVVRLNIGWQNCEQPELLEFKNVAVN